MGILYQKTKQPIIYINIDGYTNYMKIPSSLIISAYNQMLSEKFELGWKPYLMTLMYKIIHGSEEHIYRQMVHEIERVYATSLTRIIRHKKNYYNIKNLPLWIACPDYPVCKGESGKHSLRDVSVNDGLHMHAIVLMPPWSALKEDLETHFEERQALYVRSDSHLWRINTKEIRTNLEYVIDYALKSFLNGRVKDTDIIILPRSKSEL